jgi:hypothetical protein
MYLQLALIKTQVDGQEDSMTRNMQEDIRSDCQRQVRFTKTLLEMTKILCESGKVRSTVVLQGSRKI